MGTRSIIARPVDNGFEGRHVHSDGAPVTRIPVLLDMIQRDGIEKTREILLANDWTFIDIAPTQEMVRGRDEVALVENYGVRHVEVAEMWTKDSFDPDRYTDIAFIYILGDQQVTVLDPSTMNVLGRVAYAGERPDTEALYAIECGENFENCCHYAWAHDSSVPTNSRMNMRQWLGLSPLGFDQIQGFVTADGEILTPTGSGGRGSASASGYNPRLGLDRQTFWWGSVREHKSYVRLSRVTKSDRHRIDMAAIMPATKTTAEYVVPAGTVL